MYNSVLGQTRHWWILPSATVANDMGHRASQPGQASSSAPAPSSTRPIRSQFGQQKVTCISNRIQRFGRKKLRGQLADEGEDDAGIEYACGALRVGNL